MPRFVDVTERLFDGLPLELGVTVIGHAQQSSARFGLGTGLGGDADPRSSSFSVRRLQSERGADTLLDVDGGVVEDRFDILMRQRRPAKPSVLLDEGR